MSFIIMDFLHKNGKRRLNYEFGLPITSYEHLKLKLAVVLMGLFQLNTIIASF